MNKEEAFPFYWRLKDNPEIAKSMRCMDGAQVTEMIDKYRTAQATAARALKSIDLTYATPVTLLPLWKNLGAVANEKVCVVWLRERVGIIVDFDVFVRSWDDLWYPSSDDVIVANTCYGFGASFDHEEKLSIWLK